MRNISFSMTTEQYRRGEKTVTRRLGWTFLKTGEVLMGVEKCQGLRKGEHVKKIHPLRVMSVTQEPLMDIVRRPARWTITGDHVRHSETCLEGFDSMTPQEFVDMFCQHNHCDPNTEITRIEFEHIWDMPVQGRLIV